MGKRVSVRDIDLTVTVKVIDVTRRCHQRLHPAYNDTRLTSNAINTIFASVMIGCRFLPMIFTL